nr:VapE family protein [bacterium]
SGPQGIGKSTLLRKMARDWFSDSMKTFEGKEACELLQGVWFIEIGELEAFNRSEVERIKQFLSQQEDIFRAAYGRNVERHPRRCVFFGTTNAKDYLRDRTGGRRFWPVDVAVQAPTKNVFADLDGEVDQLWAEARARWAAGERLYLTAEEEQAAKAQQEEHRERHAWEGLIADFVAKDVPLGWINWPLERRRMYWSGGMADQVATEPRSRICALEVWCELLNGDVKNMRRAEAIEINSILTNLPGWQRTTIGARYGYCGYQRGFLNSKCFTL